MSLLTSYEITNTNQATNNKLTFGLATYTEKYGCNGAADGDLVIRNSDATKTIHILSGTGTAAALKINGNTVTCDITGSAGSCRGNAATASTLQTSQPASVSWPTAFVYGDFQVKRVKPQGALEYGGGLICDSDISCPNIRVSDKLYINNTVKNFIIDHPIVQNKLLVHSCIEGPRVDLIYRGRKQLINGCVTIDINKECTSNESTMVDGTFEALCQNPQVYLQNNDSFDAIVGKVQGSTLTITCTNALSRIYVDWIVIAERNDQGIKSDNKTDINGKLILEHDKNLEIDNHEKKIQNLENELAEIKKLLQKNEIMMTSS